MARGLYEQEPVFRAALDSCFKLVRPYVDFNLKEYLFPPLPIRTGRSSPEPNRSSSSCHFCSRIRPCSVFNELGNTSASHDWSQHW